MKTPLSAKIVAVLAIIAFLLLILQGCANVTINKEIYIYVINPNVNIEAEIK